MRHLCDKSRHADLSSAIIAYMALLHPEQARGLRAGALSQHIWRVGITQGLHAVLAAAMVEGIVECTVLAMQVLVPRPVRLLVCGGIFCYLHALYPIAKAHKLFSSHQKALIGRAIRDCSLLSDRSSHIVQGICLQLG